MNAQSGSYAARKAKFTEKREEIQRYFDTQGSTWLGQLLNTMSKVASANFDRDNNAQHRNEMNKAFSDFIADPKLARAAEIDEHFSVCLSFAHMFGLFVEEVNAHADEGTSVLFRPATVQSLKDPNRASSSANSRILSMSLPRRSASAFSNRKDPLFEFILPPRSDEQALKRKAATTTTPFKKRTIAVKQEEGLALDSLTPVVRGTARGAARGLVMGTPSPMTKTPSKRRDADSPAKVEEECSECGAKVKAGGLRRHMKYHAKEKEPDFVVSMDSSLLDEGDDVEEEEEDEPVEKKKPMLIKKEFDLEADSADEGSATGVRSASRVTKEVLDEWANNLLYKGAACFQCKKECISYHQLSNHLYHNHKGAAQSHYIFECLGCNKQFRSYRGAMGHVEQNIRKNEVICKNKIVYLWEAKKEVEEENDAATEEGEGEPLATDPMKNDVATEEGEEGEGEPLATDQTKNDVATEEGEEEEGEQSSVIDAPMHDNEVEVEAENKPRSPRLSAPPPPPPFPNTVSTSPTTVLTRTMAQPASDQQHNQPSVVDALREEHERSTRFLENHVKRPRQCDPNASFETKWAFTTAETKRADVEKKVSDQLGSATMSISFALKETTEEITEIDSLLRGINVREHELESMTDSLDKMCLTLAARANERKKHQAPPSTTTSGTVLGGGEVQQSRLLLEQEDIELKTAKDETTITTSAVSTAGEISMAEQPTVLGQMPADPSSPNTTSATTAHEIPARSPSPFDYSDLSAYTPLQRTPSKMDSTFTCPRTAPKSPSSSRSGSERRE